MRNACPYLSVVLGIVLMVAVVGCTTNAGPNADQKSTDGPNPIPAPGGNDSDNQGGSNEEPGDENENGGAPSAMDVLTASEQNALQNATEAANGLTNVSGTNRAGAGFPDTGPSQFTEPSEGCPSVLAALVADDDEFIFSLELDYGNGCTPLWDPEMTCSGRASGTLSLFEQQAETNFEAFTCEGPAINGEAAVSYDWTGTGLESKGTWDLQFTDEEGDRSTTGVGTTEYDLVNEIVTVKFFEGSVTDERESWIVTLEDVVMITAPCGCRIPVQGTITLAGSNIRTLTIRFSSDTPDTGEVEVSIDGGPFIRVTIREVFNLADPNESEGGANGDGANDGDSNNNGSNGEDPNGG